MKRKVLCVALSLTLCSSMVLQVGAAAVDSQSEAQMEDLTAEDEKEVPEETKTGRRTSPRRIRKKRNPVLYPRKLPRKRQLRSRNRRVKNLLRRKNQRLRR